MAFKIADMENLLSELTCGKCKKLLSVFPVYISSAIGNVCGRCTESIKTTTSNRFIERITAYESLAKHVLFPCSNRTLGCEIGLKHDEVVNHEEFCSYRQIMCPFNVDSRHRVLNCDWKGAVLNLSTHLNLSHTSGAINNPHTFVLNMDKTDIKVNFVNVELQAFIIFTKCDAETKKFYCLVMCSDEEISKKYTYQMELSKGDFRVTYPKKNSEVLIEALNKVDDMIAIDVSAVKTLVGNLDSNLHCKMSITKETNEIVESTSTIKEQTNSKPGTSIHNEIPNSSDAQQKLLQSSKQILEELKCPVCYNYMSSPIYICTKGHSICKTCKIKVDGCPMCRATISNARNYTLETLAKKVFHPCKYSRDGCTEILSADEIGKHQISCILRTDCPLIMFCISCSDTDILNPINHVNEKHSHNAINQNEICKMKLSKARNTNIYNVSISDHDMFIICHRYATSECVLKLNVFHLGQKTDAPIYKYILEFANDKCESKLSVQKPCQAVPLCISDRDVFHNCLTMHKYTLESYIDGTQDEVLAFKIKIVKI